MVLYNPFSWPRMGISNNIYVVFSIYIFPLLQKKLDMDKKLYNLAVGMFVVVLTLYIVAGLIKLYVMFK